jgi:hypothetical protein
LNLFAGFGELTLALSPLKLTGAKSGARSILSCSSYYYEGDGIDKQCWPFAKTARTQKDRDLMPRLERELLTFSHNMTRLLLTLTK